MHQKQVISLVTPDRIQYNCYCWPHTSKAVEGLFLNIWTLFDRFQVDYLKELIVLVSMILSASSLFTWVAIRCLSWELWGGFFEDVCLPKKFCELCYAENFSLTLYYQAIIIGWCHKYKYNLPLKKEKPISINALKFFLV